MVESGMAQWPLGLLLLAAVLWGDWLVPVIVPRERSAAPEVVALAVACRRVPHAQSPPMAG